MGSIYRITASMLSEDMLRLGIYPDLGHTFYWDDSWDPALYVDLARAGFISITTVDPVAGELLLPELQRSYAVLDWPELHCSRKLRRLLHSARLADEGVELRVVDSVVAVLERLHQAHGSSWILEPYAELVRRLPRARDSRFAIRGVELWSRKRDALVAGELGYTIGRTYTSLSGFCSPDDLELRHFGTLQIYLLAERLRDCGYAFWNMGHSEQSYKRALGARVIERSRFLERWLGVRDAAPARDLAAGVSCRWERE